jgi:O-antigen ligase
MKVSNLSSTKIFKLLVSAFVISLPYNRKVSSLILILLVFYWLFNIDFVNLKKHVSQIYFWVLILVFLLTIVGISYSQDRSYFAIEKKLSILVFPLIFSSIRFRFQSSDVIFIILCFIVSCFIGSVYSLLMELNRPGAFRLSSELTEITTQSIGISHVYFGIYLAFCILAIINIIFYGRGYSTLLKIALVLLATYLFFFMFVLGGKMAIIALLILAFVISIGFLIRERRFILGLIFFVIPIFTFYFAINVNPHVKLRFEKLIDEKNYFIGDNSWNSIGVRLSILKCVHEVFITAPMVGTGTGDTQSDLNQCYNSNGFITINDMNPHNQYLQILLSNGLIGLMLYIGGQVILLINCYKNKNYLLFQFIILFSLCCLTESLLERQHGVMYFSLFSSLLFYKRNNVV